MISRQERFFTALRKEQPDREQPRTDTPKRLSETKERKGHGSGLPPGARFYSGTQEGIFTVPRI